MARRAGSDAAALIAAFSGLTALQLEGAFAYARQHRAKFDKLIRRDEASAVADGDEGTNDGAEFDADLDALLDNNAEVFRRLAK
jgi:hypothetical protein